jgi:tetratricopeptide (TPR) repeat protein
MRKIKLIACIGLATLSFGQNHFVVEGSLIGSGPSGGFSVEVTEGNGRVRHARVPVHSDSTFRFELPEEGQLLEFRILNRHGDTIQVIHQALQRGVPVELRMNEAPAVPTTRETISFKRLSFQAPAKMKKAFAQSLNLRKKGKKAESLAMLQEIVRAEPAWFEAWMELGMAQAVLGESSAAADSLRKALAIDPNATEVFPLLGFVLLHSGRVEEAAEIARDGLLIRPDSLKLKYVLGLAMATAGQQSHQESLQAVALLDEVQSHFPDAMLPLADLLLRLGQFEASRDAAWRYLHMSKTPRVEKAGSIWQQASRSLQARNTR